MDGRPIMAIFLSTSEPQRFELRHIYDIIHSCVTCPEPRNIRVSQRGFDVQTSAAVVALVFTIASTNRCRRRQNSVRLQSNWKRRNRSVLSIADLAQQFSITPQLLVNHHRNNSLEDCAIHSYHFCRQIMMGNGRCPLAERSANAIDMKQTLLEYAEVVPKQLVDDTVDFGTERTSISSPLSASRHSSSTGSALTLQTEMKYIDNTRRVYIPIKLECGTQVYCAPDVLSTCPMILRSIQADVTEVLKILPWSVHNLVRRTKIWINFSYSYGPRDDPRILRHSTAHHEAGWLVHCARDRPEKARSIEIYSSNDFERMRLHWNGCGLLLHEFCHLIHQFCLGFEHPMVEQLYVEAYKSGKYEKTLRRDWAGQDEDFDMAYAMVDFKEFFAEMSVTYLSNGYNNLDTANKDIMEECCPPLLEVTVTKRIMTKNGLECSPYEYRNDYDETWSLWWSLFCKDPRRLFSRGSVPRLRIIDPIWQGAAIGRGCRNITHCNKFYPFTRGQLKNHDPALYVAMCNLWKEVAMYEDPEEEMHCCLKIAMLFPFK